MPAPTALADGCGRRVEYLRLSVTDRCDLRCRYCIPEGACDFAARADLLCATEIERIVAIFAAIGVRRVRLTGGEPLVRRDLADIAARVSAIAGIEDLSLSTNGTQLGRHAPALRAAGVARLNVSLDTLRPDRFRAISGRDALAAVVAGLDAARAAGFSPIKINMVVMAGVNEDEIEPMADWCRDRGFVLRLIEAMPMGATGRATPYRDLQPVMRALAERFGLVPGIVPGGGPARYLVSGDRVFSIGFITPLSQHFCATCNRVRLSADGALYTCVGKEASLELRTLLRQGASDRKIEAAIREAVSRKPREHRFVESPEAVSRTMAATGG